MSRPPHDRDPAPPEDETSRVGRAENTDRLEAPSKDVERKAKYTQEIAEDAPSRSVPRKASREIARGDRVDRYVILKTVGQGGMGVVYAAYDPELDRKVALKLLRTDSGDPEPVSSRARLLREAQAMARVSHPNVCAVHDAGTFDDQVFMAMEFVEGPTLHQWIRENKERPWRQLLQVFIEAGRGLSAAHEAGLVHRDFKPTNVLIGKGDRVQVTDFGLARLATAQDEEDVDPSILAVSRDDISQMLNSKVTQAGLVMGTPSYMPPEQYLGIASDARSDQFSFCAALFWSLYRRRPFDPKKVAEAARSLKRGDTGEELTFGSNPVPTGVINEPPSRSSVPAWVRRAVLRGLSLLPQDRFPTMKALLEELSQEPRRVRRRQLALGAGLAVVVAAGVGVYARRNAQVCNGAELQVAQVWNPDVRKKLEDAFSATGKPFAREAAAGVVRVLDAYARDWSHEHKEACEATRVRGTQTEELLSLRAVCLERRRKELGALARLLTTADARMMSRSMEAVDALPSLQECQDIDSLSAQVSLPADPARRARVELLNTEMAELKALGRAGRYDESVRLGAKLEHQVASIGYLPLQAELHANVGWAQQLLGDAEEGARLLELAVNEAEAARADRLKADAINKLVFVQGIQGRTEPTQQWARLAESSISRLGGDAELAAGLKGNLGNVALRQGRYDEARRYFEETRTLEESILPQDHPRRIRTTYNLGLAALLIGEPVRATQLLSDALRRMEATLGKEHPEVSQCHSMLAWAYRDSGDPQRSLQHAEASVAIRKAVFGDGHPAVADALDAVGMALIKLGRHDDARHTFEQAVDMKEKAMGPDNPALSYSYDGLGQTMLAAGRPEEAVAPLEKALSFEGVETEALAETGFSLAQALLDAGRNPSRAFAHANKARAQFAEVKKPSKVAEVDAWLAAHAQPKAVSFKLRRK